MIATADRLRSFIDLLLQSIDEPLDGEALARRAHLSRFHFDRVVAGALGETPAAFRRRLLLERAAWTLTEREVTVTEVAVDAGYGSLEAFTRAFARCFGTAPSAYRTANRHDFRVPAPSGVHFHPPGGLLIPGDEQRRTYMTLTEQMLVHDRRLAASLIKAARSLPDAALDEHVRIEPPTAAFGAEPTIRRMLHRLVFTHEMWSAAIAGREFHESEDLSLDGMLARLERTDLAQVVRDVATRDAWDTAFVDATCDPPESFTYGGAVAHVLSWDAHRREIVASTLRSRGIEPPPGDPLERV